MGVAYRRVTTWITTSSRYRSPSSWIDGTKLPGTLPERSPGMGRGSVLADRRRFQGRDGYRDGGCITRSRSAIHKVQIARPVRVILLAADHDAIRQSSVRRDVSRLRKKPNGIPRFMLRVEGVLFVDGAFVIR